MRPFEALADEPGYLAVLDAAERAVLLDVVDEVVALVDGENGAVGPADQGPAAPEHPLDTVRLDARPVVPPWDPALRRLLPDASREDPEVAAEYRRLTEADLRSAKTQNLLRLRAVLDAAQPDALVLPSEASSVAAALTDLRLVVSERLGVRTDQDADALYALVTGGVETAADEGEDDARAARSFLATVYVVLSLLQESLVDLMLQDLPAPGDHGGDPAARGRVPG